MCRAMILPMFRSTRLRVTACGIIHPWCCRPPATSCVPRKLRSHPGPLSGSILDNDPERGRNMYAVDCRGTSPIKCTCWLGYYWVYNKTHSGKAARTIRPKICVQEKLVRISNGDTVISLRLAASSCNRGNINFENGPLPTANSV